MDFFDSDLLNTDYFMKYKEAFERTKGTILLNPFRNYEYLLSVFSNIHSYNPQHAKSYAKKIKSQPKEWKNCEAIYSELIVYNFYLKQVGGNVKSLSLHEAEYDIKVDKSDGTSEYLEIFCIMPGIPEKELSTPEESIARELKTHLQNEVFTVRQKLLRKIEKQHQFTKPRNNYAVIELNSLAIADEFIVLSSLSGGYKVIYDIYSTEITSKGYDWSNSIFNDSATKNIKGIIYFNLGDYENRKILDNPHFFTQICIE